jgi:hypothetical protein
MNRPPRRSASKKALSLSLSQTVCAEWPGDGDTDIVASCEKHSPNDSRAGSGRGRVSDLSSKRTWKAMIQMCLP